MRCAACGRATEVGESDHYPPLKVYSETDTVCRRANCIDINAEVKRETREGPGLSEVLLSRLDLALDDPYAHRRDNERPDAQSTLPRASD